MIYVRITTECIMCVVEGIQNVLSTTYVKLSKVEYFYGSNRLTATREVKE
jgi:hypothetical protein